MPEKKTSLYAVAKLASVSTATVSRVINGRPGVSKKKVEEIQRIIQQLKFKPVQRRRAASLSETGNLKHGNVAIFVRGRGHYDAPELLVKQLDAISRALSDKQINPILIMGAKESDRLPLAVERRQIDGVIVFGDRLPPSISDCIEGIPIVWMTSHHEGNGEVVLSGNFEIGQAAVNYLTGKFCRRLLTLNAFPDNPVLRCRCAAFLLSAEQQGIPAVAITPQKYTDGDSDAASLRKRALEMIEKIPSGKNDFDGIFIPDDRITAVMHPILKEFGLLETGGARIISCGNENDYLLGLHPRPASIDIGPEILGDQAVKQLLRITQGEDRDVRVNVTISPRVVDGDE